MDDRLLRRTSVVFAAALLVHGADHLRRGIGAMTTQVFVGGNVQFVLAGVAIALVWRRHRLAPAAAVVVGFASALLFITAHLLPQWSAFSDSYTGAQVAPGVTAFSWFTALFEIAADLAFGWAGAVTWRRHSPAFA